MTNPNTPEDELESKLTKDLKHSLKLVPESQRELFVFELSQYLAKDRTNLITQLEAKKHTDYINDIHYVEDDEFNAGIDTAIEVLRGE